MPKALVTGITGQDGSYLTELLLSKGYDVHGLIRRASTFNTERIDHLYVDPHEEGARLKYRLGWRELNRKKVKNSQLTGLDKWGAVQYPADRVGTERVKRNPKAL